MTDAAKAHPGAAQRAVILPLLAHGALGTVDGHGFGASPKTGDPNAEIRVYREALDAGAHKPIGRLSPDMSETELGQDFTFRLTASAQGREWKGLEGLPLKKTG